MGKGGRYYMSSKDGGCRMVDGGVEGSWLRLCHRA